MQRRKFSREFKLEAVRLVQERGVAVAQAARDLAVHENVLRRSGSVLSRQWPDEAGAVGDRATTLRRTRYEVRLYRKAPSYLAGGMDVRGTRCFAKRLSCLADTRPVTAFAPQ